MRRIQRTPFEKLSHINNCTFGPLIRPIDRIRPGETVEVETWDCFANTLTSGQTWKKVCERGDPIYENPITGPLYVETAEPGDALVVEITNISLPPIGVTVLGPGFGGLAEYSRVDCVEKFVEIRNGKVAYMTDHGRQAEIPVDPFVGTIGVSPLSEAISTTIPGKHGGNMDLKYASPNNRLYLPVAVEGALLGLGDVHAAQGDGEICETGVEIPSIVTLKVDVLKKKPIGWPRVESQSELVVVCSARLMEDATKLGFIEAIKWLEEDYGLERQNAFLLLGLTAKIFVAQIVNPLVTIAVGIPKGLLPRPECARSG